MAVVKLLEKLCNRPIHWVAAIKFELCRIGDTVSARNTHAAIYDALRLMKDI